MGNRRALLIVVAVVLAVVAFGGAFFLISGAEDNAKKDLAEVYVATQPIAAGATLDASMFTIKKVESRPVDAITDLSTLTGKVALISISQDTPLTTGSVGSPAEQKAIGGGGTLASELKPGEEAVTFSVDLVRGLAGWIQPGDTINLNVLLPPAEGQTEKRVQQLLRDLKVIRTTAATDLATTTTAAAAGGSAPVAAPPSSGTITVITDANGAQLIANASQFEVYLSLNAAPTTTQPATTTTAKSSDRDN